MKNIYDLKLFEKIALSNNEVVTRVPGGWVYGDMQGTCFIPFDNEFQEIVPKERNGDTANNTACNKFLLNIIGGNAL